MSARQTVKITVYDKDLQAVLAVWPEWKKGTGLALAGLAVTSTRKILASDLGTWGPGMGR